MLIFYNIKHLYFFYQNVLLEGYAAHQLLLQLHDYILGQMALGNEQKAVIFEKAAVRQIFVIKTFVENFYSFIRWLMDVYLMVLMNIYN